MNWLTIASSFPEIVQDEENFPSLISTKTFLIFWGIVVLLVLMYVAVVIADRYDIGHRRGRKPGVFPDEMREAMGGEAAKPRR